MSQNNVLEFVREEDFVEYFIFPSIKSENENEQQQQLLSLLKKVNEIVSSLTHDYLWHKDPFKLIQRTSITSKLNHLISQNDTLPPHLYGITHFGDNIEDEWFIVYILITITKQMPDLIARVHDNDGEFLLIESADYLPQWAQPEICDNRVYLIAGNIHIIPPEDDETISLSEALCQLSATTKAPPDIQNAINHKIGVYPKKIQENLHRATIYVPIGVANILKHKPSFIAPAIQAFCNRDSIDMKVCRAMKYFPPENCVFTQVVFTKLLYAMLSHSKYTPDRRTGWKMPSPSDSRYNAHNLGVKVACGFEILISQAKPSADIESDKAWHKYLDNLKENNYFKGLIEHSKGYNELLTQAKEYYKHYRDSMQYTPAIGQEILNLTKNLEYNVDDFNNCLTPDDSDDWLNISPSELNEMLEEKYGKRDFVKVTENSNTSDLSENMSKFLNHMSGIEGAEFPNDEKKPPQRPPRNKKNSKVSFLPETTNKVNFDPNSFSCALQNILNLSIPEDDSWDLESGSDMSEYGDDNYVNSENYDQVKNKMQQYMEEMDKELAKTTIGQSFEKKPEDFEDIENFQPVDIDVNALKNIMESYRSQLGEAGPSMNMLGPMGVHLDSKRENEKE